MKIFDDEFDNVIKKILSKVFDEYYINSNNKIYCIDNLYKKFYVGKYNKIMKKYGSIKKDDLIFRFNRYNKKAYIIKLLKENFRVILDEHETNDSVANMVLEKSGIKNYKPYIDNIFKIERGMIKVCKKEVDKKVFKKVDNDFMEYSNCLTCICYGHYCPNHNKDMI